MTRQTSNSEMGSNNIQNTLSSDIGTSQSPFGLGEIFGRSKSKEAFESQCSAEKIIQFFKCSRRLCDFTCDDNQSFYYHLLGHNEDEEQDVCVYCERMFVIENLARHMEAQHGNRRFQCKLCFYRGCTRAHLIVHCIMQHNLKFVTGIACPRMPGALMPDVKARARTLLYRCSLCAFRAFGRDTFEHHLRTSHPETTTGNRSIENDLRPSIEDRSSGSSLLFCVYCQAAEQQVSSDVRLYSGNELIAHLDEFHGFANRLICLYCGDTLQSEDALIHMTELHSDWPINILDRSAKSGSSVWNRENSHSQIVASPSKTTTTVRKYSAAPRSVQEKRQQRLNNNAGSAPTATTSAAADATTATMRGGASAVVVSSTTCEAVPRLSTNSPNVTERPEKVPSKPRSILKKKLTSTSSNSTVADLPPERQRVLRCASCLCTDPATTVDYLSQEALALHMRDKHNVYYICQQCFHGEEKFRLIQAHIAQCEGATELDIVTLKNGALKTSSKVRSTQKERQQHAAATAGAALNQARPVSNQMENRAIGQVQYTAAVDRDSTHAAGSSRDVYLLLNDLSKGPILQSDNVEGGSISNSKTSKVGHTNRVSAGHVTQSETSSGDVDSSGMKSSHVGGSSSSRKRDRGTPSWAGYGHSGESTINVMLEKYRGHQILQAKFEQLAGRSYPLVKRLSPEELKRWGAL